MEIQRIILDKGILGGKPIIRGTRISVSLILTLLADGLTTNDILQEYPHLRKEDVLAAIDYAAKVIADEEIILSKVT
jgi:uncharacterized protein (DUF433 family)